MPNAGVPALSDMAICLFATGTTGRLPSREPERAKPCNGLAVTDRFPVFSAGQGSPLHLPYPSPAQLGIANFVRRSFAFLMCLHGGTGRVSG